MKGKIGGIIVLLIGLGLLTGGYFAWKHQSSFLATAVKAEGTVVSMDRESSRDSNGNTSYTYYPQISFTTADNQSIEFRGSTGSNPPSYQTGDKVEVLYDPKTPTSASINSFTSLWLGPIILGVLGAVFSLVGVGIFRWAKNHAAMLDFLKRSGRRIQAKVNGAELNTSYKVNGKSPYQISCQWLNPENNQVHVFKSDNIWFDPTPYLKRESVDVLIDPRDPKRHLVDISFLPKQA